MKTVAVALNTRGILDRMELLVERSLTVIPREHHWFEARDFTEMVHDSGVQWHQIVTFAFVVAMPGNRRGDLQIDVVAT